MRLSDAQRSEKIQQILYTLTHNSDGTTRGVYQEDSNLCKQVRLDLKGLTNQQLANLHRLVTTNID